MTFDTQQAKSCYANPQIKTNNSNSEKRNNFFVCC